MHPRTLGWWLVVAVLTLGTPAWAHVGTASAPVAAPPVGLETLTVETLTAAAPSMDSVWMLVSATAIIGVAIARRRRAIAVAGIALLLVVAFEAGVHSVHHVADARDAECVVASATAHTSGVTVDTVAFQRPADTTTSVAVASIVSVALHPSAPARGRAPPTA